MEKCKDDKMDCQNVLPDREGLRDAGGAGLLVPGGQRTLLVSLRGRFKTADKRFHLQGLSFAGSYWLGAVIDSWGILYVAGIE
ncbi:hypothetical protein N7490_005016 [Penicillium lividum]|nr:hypothetical protein N7490_005016 [Penicillium lividum]